MENTARLYQCGLCRCQVTICSRCDRGHVCCGPGCSATARRASVPNARLRWFARCACGNPGLLFDQRVCRSPVPNEMPPWEPRHYRDRWIKRHPIRVCRWNRPPERTAYGSAQRRSNDHWVPLTHSYSDCTTHVTMLRALGAVPDMYRVDVYMPIPGPTHPGAAYYAAWTPQPSGRLRLPRYRDLPSRQPMAQSQARPAQCAAPPYASSSTIPYPNPCTSSGSSSKCSSWNPCSNVATSAEAMARLTPNADCTELRQ